LTFILFRDSKMATPLSSAEVPAGAPPGPHSSVATMNDGMLRGDTVTPFQALIVDPHASATSRTIGTKDAAFPPCL
jgi:hypothetical protein